MAMTTDLQARLRECIRELHEGVEKGWRIAEPQYFERHFIEAADEIARLTDTVERLAGAIESPPKPMMDWIMEQSVKFAGCPRPSKLKHQTGRGLAKAILLLAGQYLRNEAALTDYQGDGK